MSTVKDILCNNGTLLTYPQIIVKFGQCLTWFQYAQLVSAIPQEWKVKLSGSTSKQFALSPFETISSCFKICNIVYTKLVLITTKLPLKMAKWKQRLNIQLEFEEFIQLFSNISTVTIATKRSLRFLKGSFTAQHRGCQRNVVNVNTSDFP